MWTLVIIILSCYMLLKLFSIFSYWKKRGVTGPIPDPLFGNLEQVIWSRKHNIMTIAAKIYNEYLNEKVVGIYQGLTPTLIVRDPKIIREVIISNFLNFNSRGLDVGKTPVMTNLFVAVEDDWKTLRKTLSPLFTISKLKSMLPDLNMHIKKHIEYIETNIRENTSTEIRTLNAKYTISSFSALILGKQFDTYAQHTSEAEKIAYESVTVTPFRRIGYLMNNIYPGKMVEFLLTHYPQIYWTFFVNLTKDLIQNSKSKSSSGAFIEQFVILNKGSVENGSLAKINIDLITAQAALFFGAGYETTASSMTFLLYELSLHPKIQENCQDEIDSVMKKFNFNLDYNALTNELPYLSMVIDETLRKYPVGGLLTREVLSDYTFKDIGLTIKKGTKLWVPILALHNDPKYFVEPEKFDPDRFLPENRSEIYDYYYPFGAGPRICIAFRFAKLQLLMGVAHFLHKFQVRPCEKTVKKVAFDPSFITLVAKHGIWLNIKQRVVEEKADN